MVIYEVNLSIQPASFAAFETWLIPHIEQMLTFEGFISAQTLEREEDGPNRHLTVQYQVRDRTSLDHYFTHHAEQMRDDGLKRFEGQFTASRRILIERERYDRLPLA